MMRQHERAGFLGRQSAHPLRRDLWGARKRGALFLELVLSRQQQEDAGRKAGREQKRAGV